LTALNITVGSRRWPSAAVKSLNTQPFTGGDGPLPGDDWTWLLSVATLGVGIVLAVALRRALGRRDDG